MVQYVVLSHLYPSEVYCMILDFSLTLYDTVLLLHYAILYYVCYYYFCIVLLQASSTLLDSTKRIILSLIWLNILTTTYCTVQYILYWSV